MKRIALLVSVLLLSADQGIAQEKFDPAARLATVAPFIDEQTVAIGHVDIERIDVPELMKLVASAIPLAADDSNETKRHVTEATRKGQQIRHAFLDSGARSIYFVVSIADLPGPPFVVVPVKEGGDDEAITELVKEIARLPETHKFNRTLVFGSAVTIERLKALKPVARPDFVKAFAAAGDTTAQFAFSPSDDNRRVLREMLPKLPQRVGGGSGATLADGVQWAAISVNAPPKLSLNVTIQSKDAESAAALQNLMLSSLKLLGPNEEIREALPKFNELVKLVTPEVKGDQLVLEINEQNGGTQKVIEALAVPLQVARMAAGRAQSMNNLKQFGLAMHNYHDTYGKFPARVSRTKEGKPLLSWRVHILPFIDDDSPLYKQFRLDEPWDSEHNLKLVEKMPPVLASANLTPDQIAKGMTTYVVPHRAMAPNAAPQEEEGVEIKQMVFDVPEGAKMQHIVDGTSNTIMILEVNPKHAVVWTKPDDVEIDLKDPLKAIKGQPKQGFNAAIADGSVKFIKESIDLKNFRRLLLMNDGEPVDAF